MALLVAPIFAHSWLYNVTTGQEVPNSRFTIANEETAGTFHGWSAGRPLSASAAGVSARTSCRQQATTSVEPACRFAAHLGAAHLISAGPDFISTRSKCPIQKFFNSSNTLRYGV